MIQKLNGADLYSTTVLGSTYVQGVPKKLGLVETAILYRKTERKTGLSYSKLTVLNDNLWIYVGDIIFRPQMISKVALLVVLISG